MHFGTHVSQSGDRCGDMGVIEVGGNTGAITHRPVINEFSRGAIYALTNSLILSLSDPLGSLDDGSVRAA